MSASDESEKPKAHYERNYAKPPLNDDGSEFIHENVRRSRGGVPPTLMSFVVGVLFGVVIPLFLRAMFLGDFLETVSPSEPLPVAENGDSDYNGIVDLTSPKGFLDQVMEKLTVSLTALWTILLIYLFPIMYQLRIAVIYGKLTQTLCLALTLLGPPAVLILAPLWSSVLAS